MKRAHCSLALRFVLVLIGIALLGLSVFTIFFNKTCEPAQLPYGVTINSDLDSTFISWYKRLPNECEVTYQLRYIINNAKEIEASTSDLFYRLPRLEACSSLRIRLWVEDESGDESGNYLIESYTEEPTSFGPVQNLEICVCQRREATLSWDSRINSTQCEFNYIVTAQNGGYTQEVQCNDVAECSLTLTNFCPYTNVTVRESTGLVEEVVVTYDC